jgi:2-keto-3-deoxy-L-rhamnonate aldolase RhmA
VVAIIEEAEAVAHIEEIAAEADVDVLFVGPSDLAFSLGLRGDMAHPRVQEAMVRVAAVVREHGKAAGRLATTRNEVERALDQGFLFLQGATELELMARCVRELLDPAGRVAISSAVRPLY